MKLLYIAHPGHELLLYDAFATLPLRVMVLSDGSGSQGSSRIEQTRELVTRLGGETALPFGCHTDAALYAALLRIDVEFFGGLVDDLTAALEDPEIDGLISDAAEHYNPIHDLSCAIATLAVRRVRRNGKAISHFVCPMTADAAGVKSHDKILSVETVERKLRDAEALSSLISDLSDMVSARPAIVDREVLVALHSDAPILPVPEGEVYYEIYGRERLASRGGGELITYAGHMAPLVTALERREEALAL